MICHTPIRSGRLAGALLATLLGWAAVPAGASDPYLAAINAEGNRMESLGRARQEQDALVRQHRGAAPAARSTAAATVTSQQQFEDMLRTNFPGSYALYSIMTPAEQQEVYGEFQKKDVEGTARFIPVVVKIIAITSANSANRARALNK